VLLFVPVQNGHVPTFFIFFDLAATNCHNSKRDNHLNFGPARAGSSSPRRDATRFYQRNRKRLAELGKEAISRPARGDPARSEDLEFRSRPGVEIAISAS
jgi:hypothetical protein